MGMSIAEARRCVRAAADYLRRVDDSPRAAGDLLTAVKTIETHSRPRGRHHCAKNGWSLCSACRGRIHMQGCTSKKRPDRDCCKRRHVKLAREGHYLGLDDESLPMVDDKRPTWAEE